MHAFKEKLCVITGAGSGIGRGLALRLAADGARLALSDVNAQTLAETAGLAGLSNRVRTDVLDVADASAIEAYAQTVRDSLGPADYLFNVAGVSRVGRFEATPLSSFEKVMDVNFWGVVRLSKAFLPQLLQTQGGLVNISSLFGFIGVPGQAHYCASKFAVRGFNEALAGELEPRGVRVTSVHPGGVATNIARSAAVDALPESVADKAALDARFDKVARMSPDKAAEIILVGVAKGRRRVIVGGDAKLVSFLQRLFPENYGKLVSKLGENPLN